MHTVEITGLKKRIFADTGHAAIRVDGSLAYDGRATWNRDSLEVFEITDTAQHLVARATAETKSRYHAFLGHGSRVIRDAASSEIARITYTGFFGFRRTATIGQRTFPLPRGPRVKLPDATISIDGSHRTATAEISAESLLLAYLVIAFDLWLLEETSS